ncbi:MAG: hypothetical protein R2795_22265 [Saprospiraceae bacterium]
MAEIYDLRENILAENSLSSSDKADFLSFLTNYCAYHINRSPLIPVKQAFLKINMDIIKQKQIIGLHEK